MGLPLRLGLLLADLRQGEWSTPAPPTGRTSIGTGPFQLTDFVSGNSNTYTKNPIYWGKEKIGGQDYKLPFVDKITYRTIKDEATWHHRPAHRQARHPRGDPLAERRLAEEERAAAAVEPLARPVRHLHGDAHRRRRAVQGRPRAPRAQHGGQQGRDRQGLLQRQRRAVRLSAASRLRPATSSRWTSMPASVKELFTYDPAKAKKLLGRGGYPKGFTTKVQVCSCNPDHMDLLPLVAAYLEQVGVKLEIQPMEYGAFLSRHDLAHAHAGLLHEHRATSTRRRPSARASSPAQLWNPVGLQRSRVRREDGRGLSAARRGQAPVKMLREMTRRDPRPGALHLAADRPTSTRRGGRG